MMQAVLFLAALVVLLAAFTGFAFLARSFQRAFFLRRPAVLLRRDVARPVDLRDLGAD